MTQLLADALADEEVSPKTLRVLDFGAGNGMEGQELQNLEVDHVVGADIIPEAMESTLRDRGWAYADYVVADFTALPADDEKRLRSHKAKRPDRRRRARLRRHPDSSVRQGDRRTGDAGLDRVQHQRGLRPGPRRIWFR